MGKPCETYRFILFVVLFSITTSGIGQNHNVITLEKAISIAADSSIQALNARNKHLQSEWQYRVFKVYYLPTVTLQTNPVSYNRVFVKRYDSQSNRDIYREQQSFYSYGNLSIQQNLGLTGGKFFIDTELGYLQNFGGNNPYTQFSAVPFRIGYSQSLFGYNPHKWDKQIEPVKYDKVQKQLLYDIASVAETAVGYFFDLAVSQTTYELAKQNQANTDTLYKIAEERYRLGSLNRGDLLSLKLQWLNSKTAFEKAKLYLKRSHTAFYDFLRMDTTRRQVFEITLPTEIPQTDISVAMAVQKAIENNPIIPELKEKELTAQRDLEQTKKSNRFSANISASLGFNQVANNLSAAYARPLQQNIATVNFTIPILDWGIGKGKVTVATENLKVVKTSNEQSEKTFIREVELSINELNLNRASILPAKEAKMVADEAYETTKELFIIGKAEVSSLNLAVSGQMEAQQSYIQALKNYWNSYYKVRKLTLWEF